MGTYGGDSIMFVVQEILSIAGYSRELDVRNGTNDFKFELNRGGAEVLRYHAYEVSSESGFWAEITEANSDGTYDWRELGNHNGMLTSCSPTRRQAPWPRRWRLAARYRLPRCRWTPRRRLRRGLRRTAPRSRRAKAAVARPRRHASPHLRLLRRPRPRLTPLLLPAGRAQQFSVRRGSRHAGGPGGAGPAGFLDWIVEAARAHDRDASREARPRAADCPPPQTR